jgi:endoglucanase
LKLKLLGVATTILLVGSCDGQWAGAAHSAPASRGASSDATRYNAHILVDQFGYRPSDPKFAVIRNPKVGFDAADSFTPGTTYQVRRADNGSVIQSGKPIIWNKGATDPSSGDVAWWFDFSTLQTPGDYYIFDTGQNVRSAVFTVDQQVYRNILKAAVRMFFYQRAGAAKQAPYADKCWTDDAAYVADNQDSQAHDITDPHNRGKVRDLSGGWFDAGDTNKYVTNATTVVHQLLTAYQDNPAAFTDDFNIPESGNGVPDLIDEVKWETDWLRKMQYPDGSVALKVGDTEYRTTSPPSSDKSARFYVPACTSSTIAAAGMFAHASYVYAKLPKLGAEADSLKDAALRAWHSYQSTAEKQEHCDSGEVKVPGSDQPADMQETQAVVASVYLFAITGDKSYDDYFKAHYSRLRPFNDAGWMRYSAEQGEAALFYTRLPSADDKLKYLIVDSKLKDVQNNKAIYGAGADDPYRNFFDDYVWGSNQARANYGSTNMAVKLYGIPVQDATPYVSRALDTLHYFHGVNPFGKVYLSNMYQYGATDSVNEIFGGWFVPGSKWGDAKTSECGPPPGYVPGGPNAHAASHGVPANEIPPVGQPPQKSYKDWNGANNSWVISEPDDMYQSAYVQLISAFVD